MPHDDEEVASTELGDEIKLQARLALPNIAGVTLSMCLSLVNVLFVGHYLTTTDLDAVGISSSIVNVLGQSIGFGLASAAETYSSQAFGSTRKSHVGMMMQRCLLILGLACLPCILLWWNVENGLLLIKVDPMVARVAGKYLRTIWLLLPFRFAAVALMKFLQAQSIMTPFMYAGIVANVFNVFINWLLIVHLDLGVSGSAYALLLSTIVQTLYLLIYVYFYYENNHHCWAGWSVECLDEWGSFVKMGTYGLLMLCFDWWFWEITSLAGGYFGSVPLGTQVVLMQVSMACIRVPLGVSSASSTRVANALGAGNPQQAKISARASLCLAATWGLIAASILLFGGRGIAGLFTHDLDVIAMVVSLLPLLSLSQFFDGFQATIAGILRASGQQSIGAWYNFLGYEVVGVPCCYLLAFYYHQGIYGLWVATVIAVALQCMLFLSSIQRTVWQYEALMASRRCNKSSISVIQTDPDLGEKEELAAPNYLEGEDISAAETSTGLEMTEITPTKRRELIRRRQMQCAVASLVFIAALAISNAHTPHGPICYPLPVVEHASGICDGATSLSALHTCKVECLVGRVQGQFRCNRIGVLDQLPICNTTVV